MKKLLLFAVASSIMLSGCASFKRLPSGFDNVEYRDLVELNVLSQWSESCSSAEIDRMNYLGAILKTYGSGTLNSDIAKIYSEINDLTSELRARPNPSETYCKLKRKNITEVTGRAIEVFGRRLK